MKRSNIILFAVIANLAALAYPPYSVSGVGIEVARGWDFIFASLASILDNEVRVYEHLDWKVLAIELLAINLLVVGLLAISKKR